MADRILVVAEQREGKLNRISLETLAAAQAIGKETGWPVEVVLPGYHTSALAQELAGHKVEKVYDLEGASLEAYTSDGYVSALKQLIASQQPKLVLFPHTYQVRDFAPRLALALDRTLISDAIGYKYENGKLLFTRQMFQGKFVADVAFAGEAPVAGDAADWNLSLRTRRRGVPRRWRRSKLDSRQHCASRHTKFSRKPSRQWTFPRQRSL